MPRPKAAVGKLIDGDGVGAGIDAFRLVVTFLVTILSPLDYYFYVMVTNTLHVQIKSYILWYYL